MNDQHPTDPVLSQVQPVPGGPYADQPYEAALSDLRTTVAEVSAALRHANEDTAARLAERQRELNRLQIQLRPDDTEALTRAHELCRAIRQELPGSGA